MQTKTLLSVGAVTAGVLALSQSAALAATAQMTSLPVDQLAVTFFNSLINVWILIVALVALIGLVINMFFGFFQSGPRVVGFVFGCALLAGGLPLMATLFGGNLVTSLILP
jgi:hypothetical protein